jgi:hypothetical protein
LIVSRTSFNTTDGDSVCDVYSYSSSGSLTCNLTGYDGDFFAKGFISRSPEKLDKIISIVISTVQENLGILSAVISLALIITVVFAVGATSRGNPSAMLFAFGITILALKLMTILPLGWITVSVIEVGTYFLAKLTKT